MAQILTTSRVGISVNLPTGANYDLLLVTTPEGYPEGNLEFRFESTPRKITGIQKVAQLFLKTLFTQKGSDVIYPDKGTNFPNLTVGANRQSDDDEFISDVTATLQDAENQVKYNSVDSDEASSLASITLLGFEYLTETLSLYIRIITEAGETASIAIPFPELDLKLSTNA
jgi:phage baseplate assembly protein W